MALYDSPCEGSFCVRLYRINRINIFTRYARRYDRAADGLLRCSSGPRSVTGRLKKINIRLLSRNPPNLPRSGRPPEPVRRPDPLFYVTCTRERVVIRSRKSFFQQQAHASLMTKVIFFLSNFRNSENSGMRLIFGGLALPPPTHQNDIFYLHPLLEMSYLERPQMLSNNIVLLTLIRRSLRGLNNGKSTFSIFFHCSSKTRFLFRGYFVLYTWHGIKNKSNKYSFIVYNIIYSLSSLLLLFEI